MKTSNSSNIKNVPALYGLVLAGGLSKRMGQDKAQLCYHGQTQLAWSFQLLSDICEQTFVSVTPTLKDESSRRQYPQIIDDASYIGPTAGILSAMRQYPNNAWMVIACDLPLLDKTHLTYLQDNRDATRCATAYHSEHDNLPEPLCAIWEPRSYEYLHSLYEEKITCPRKILIQLDTCLLTPRQPEVLMNINTPHEMSAVKNLLERIK